MHFLFSRDNYKDELRHLKDFFRMTSYPNNTNSLMQAQWKPWQYPACKLFETAQEAEDDVGDQVIRVSPKWEFMAELVASDGFCLRNKPEFAWC